MYPCLGDAYRVSEHVWASCNDYRWFRNLENKLLYYWYDFSIREFDVRNLFSRSTWK